MAGVLAEIAKLPSRFTLTDIQAWRPEGERVTLDDPLMGVGSDLRLNIETGVATSDRERRALIRCRVAHNYFDNVTLLLAFILNDLQDYREGNRNVWPERLRLPLDLEKLLSDTRSMLDSLYSLVLLYQPAEISISRAKRESFGKFSDWYDRDAPGPFAPPLDHLVEIIPWAQDIRSLRDGYVHHGHESLVFYGDTELYLDPLAHRPPPRARIMPDRFYEPTNPNNLIVVEKFLAYIVAPVLAVRRQIGNSLHALLEELAGWKHYGIGMPYQQGPGVVRMRDWVNRNTEALDPTLFCQRYFATNAADTNE